MLRCLLQPFLSLHCSLLLTITSRFELTLTRYLFVIRKITISSASFQLLEETRRPEPKGAEDIGTWGVMLDMMSTASVITNALLICFTASATTGMKDDFACCSFYRMTHRANGVCFKACSIRSDRAQRSVF